MIFKIVFSVSRNNVIFCTRKGEVQVYDFVTHRRVFADQIFVGQHKVSTMKFHPTGMKDMRIIRGLEDP